MNPFRLGAAAQLSWRPSLSGSQMVHNVPSPRDSTSRAMIVSTSAKGAPARINRRMSSTDSEENKPGSFRTSLLLEIRRAGECIADSISSPLLTLLRKKENVLLSTGLVVVSNWTRALVNAKLVGHDGKLLTRKHLESVLLVRLPSSLLRSFE